MERIRIGGIKLSQELTQFNFHHLPPEREILAALCRLFAQERISVPFLSHSFFEGRILNIACCVPAQEQSKVDKLLADHEILRNRTESIPSVGMVTIYPRGSDLCILGVILEAWGGFQLPLYGCTTSISSISCITDYRHLMTAVTSLEPYLILPSDHAPLVSNIQIEQNSTGGTS